MFLSLDIFSRKQKRANKRAEFCLERVGLEDAHSLYPSEISGGMIAHIARAIGSTPLSFCDEPNSGLDPKTSQLLMSLLTILLKILP